MLVGETAYRLVGDDGKNMGGSEGRMLRRLNWTYSWSNIICWAWGEIRHDSGLNETDEKWAETLSLFWLHFLPQSCSPALTSQPRASWWATALSKGWNSFPQSWDPSFLFWILCFCQHAVLHAGWQSIGQYASSFPNHWHVAMFVFSWLPAQRTLNMESLWGISQHLLHWNNHYMGPERDEGRNLPQSAQSPMQSAAYWLQSGFVVHRISLPYWKDKSVMQRKKSREWWCSNCFHQEKESGRKVRPECCSCQRPKLWVWTTQHNHETAQTHCRWLPVVSGNHALWQQWVTRQNNLRSQEKGTIWICNWFWNMKLLHCLRCKHHVWDITITS